MKNLTKKLLMLAFMLGMMSMASAQLSGNYIIGDGGDYSILSLALGDLGVNGASGDVTFIIEDGYNVSQTLTFPDFTGDDMYTVTIRPADNATSITFTGPSFGALFRLNAAVSNYIIDGADPITGNNVFTFEMASGQNAFLLGGSNLVIKNCTFKLLDDNAIETSTFNGGYSNITIDNCDFINVNTVSTVNIRAIWIRFTNPVPNIRIENCRFYSDPASPDLQTYFPIYSPGAITVINNVINARAGNFIGLEIDEKDETAEIHHNTINLYGTQSSGSSGTVYGMRIGFGTSPVGMQNNIVNITRSYPSGWTKIGISGTVSTPSDNNIHILDDTQSNWGYLTSGDDQSSVLSSHPTYTFSAPAFTDEANNDLTLSGAALNNPDFRGVNAGITTDSEGSLRNSMVPAKGALEHSNSVADITSFTGPNVIATTIDNSMNTVDFVLSNGSSQTFAPTIGLFSGAQGVSPASGITQNFSTPVVYTVTAEDGTQDTWTITNKIPNTEADIESFSVAEQTGPAVIDPINRTVDIELGRNAPGTFTPEMTISAGATITAGYNVGDPINRLGNAFEETLTILSEDGLTAKDWMIRMTMDPYEGGTYTVGSGDDFENLKEAMDALDNFGYDGDVVLEIQADYPSAVVSGQHRLDWISVNTGSSLTIRPADDVTEVTIDMGTQIIFFIDMQDFTIDGENKLKFISTSSTFLSVTGNVSIKNLECQTAGRIVDYRGSLIPTGSFSGNLQVTGCTFNYVGSTISSSHFFNLNNGTQATFDSNIIDMGNSYNGTGKPIFRTSSINASFTNNVITIDGVSWPSLEVFDLNSLVETVEVLHNTVFISGTASGTEEITFVETNASGGSIANIENNLVQIERNPGAAGKLVGINISPNQSYDGNNIFLQSGSHTRTYFEQHGSTLYDDSNIAAMQAAYPETTIESVSFVSTATNDFYLSGSSLNSRALRTTNLVAGITNDLRSVSRSASAVTKGAYEAPNNFTDIFEISLAEIVGDATITNGSSTISAEVPAGTGFSLDPGFTLFPGASISPNSGTTQDFTSPVTYTVTAEDGTMRDWSVTITEENAAPTDVSLANADINENGGTNAIVSLILNTDLNTSDTHTYQLVAGTGSTDNALFNINDNTLRATNSLDHEASDTRSVRLRVTDAGGLSFEKAVTIAVLDVNDEPTNIFLSNSSIQENLAVGTTVGTLTSADQDAGDTHTYSLKPGTPDNAFFTIDGDELKTGTMFDFETKDTYNLEIFTNDGNGGQYEQEFAVSITDEASVITDITLSGNSLDESQGQGILIGTFSVQGVDLSGAYTYDFVSGTGDAGNASFNISNDDILSFAAFNHEVFPSIDIRVEASGIGGTFVKVFTININDLVEPPTDIDLSNNTIQESLAIGTAIGTLSTIDEDEGETYTYTLVSGSGDSGNGSFQIVGDELRSLEVFDFETQTSYSVRIQTDDGNDNQYTEAFTIEIGDIGPSITDIGLTNDQIDENNSTPLTVGTFSTLGEEVTGLYTYSLVSGDGDGANSSFFISGDELRTNAVFNHEAISSLSIRVRTDDGVGSFFEKAINITINDVNEAPTSVSLNQDTFDETEDLGAITTFIVQDADADDSYTVTLVNGPGDTDNDMFSVVAGESPGTFGLKNEVPFNFESQSSFSIRVHVEDGGGLLLEGVLTINVNDINDEPTDITLSNAAIDENLGVNQPVGTLSTVDEDNGQTYTYLFITGQGSEDNTSFGITNDQLTLTPSANFETKNTYNIRIRTDDGNGGLFEKALVIHINDVNEAPTNIQLSNTTIEESTPIGTLIGTLGATDEDTNDSHTYTTTFLCQNCESANMEGGDLVQIVGNELRSGAIYDFETNFSLGITIRSTDNGGLFTEKDFIITIVDLPASVTSLDLSNTSINENENAGTAVGTFSTTGEDLSGNYTYTLVSGDGDTDNASFSVSGDQLLTSASFDFETKSSYNIRIMTDDGSLTREESFTITVNNVSEAPTDLSLSETSIAENNEVNAVIGSMTTTDEDTGELYSYSLVAGDGDTDNASFNINGSELRATDVFDFETKNSYSVRIETNDGNGGTYQEAFIISITNQNESISVINPIADQSLDEGFASVDIDLTNVFNDEDSDPLTYEVSSSSTSVVTVANSGTTLTISEVGIGTSTISVTANDGSGATTTDTFDFTVIELPVGFEDEISVEVYPNPTTSILNIKSNEVLNIDLMDLNGRRLKAGEGKELQMDLDDLSSGIYLLKITSKQSTVTRRIKKAN